MSSTETVAGKDFRHFLRASTRQAHERLDGLVGALDSRERYRRFLLGLYAYRAPVEAFLREASWPEELGDWRPQEIAGLLAQDLADLGEEVPAEEAVALSNDGETLIGLSYVLEGSALGARILIGQAANLGYDEHNGARHLRKQAGDLTNWRSFIERLGDLPGLDRERVADAANASFEHASRMMIRAGEG